MAAPTDLDRHPQMLAFLEAIREQPDDDLPRLACADWLEEHGDPDRAAFIRVQIEMENLPEHNPRRDELEDRETALRSAHETDWRGALADFTTECTFRRGFIERIKLGVRQFLENADRLFALAPTVCELQLLRVSQSKLSMIDLAANPHLKRLRALSLNGSCLGDPRVAVLLENLALDDLEELDLRETHAGDLTLRQLCKVQLPRLHTLLLARNSLADRLGAWAGKALPFPLRTLDLAGAALARAEVETLADWPGLAGLTTLGLAGNSVGAGGMETLAPRLGALTRLDLANCQIGIRGSRALAESQALVGLTRLDLTGNAVKRAGLEALLASGHLRNLEGLHLAVNGLGDAGMQALAAWSPLEHQPVLHLGNNELSAAGVQALTQSPLLGEPFVLGLGGNPIGAQGARHLAGCSRLRRLHTLYLDLCDLTAEAVEPLVTSPWLGSVRRLELQFNKFGRGDARKRLAGRFPGARFD
jgi:uncharacterized protein (TIGR02996 family)